jgi:hypothetical protein
MGNSVQLQIRQIIFEKYNDPNTRFTNDEIFAVLQKSGAIEKSLTIDDMESDFAALCDAGIMRNIAQNFTTQWFKIFDPLEKVSCQSCHKGMHVNKAEEKTCPECGKPI